MMSDKNLEKRKAIRSVPSFRRRPTIEKAVQTEATFSFENVNVNEHYEKLASDQFQDLLKLRDVICGAMREVACSVYDVVAFKDVIFKIEDELPSKFPVTDILLLSSKLFRRTAELGRLLGCFFSVVFAEGHADDSFHFTELRFLRRELLNLKTRLAKAEDERAKLQHMVNDISKVVTDHSRSVDLLESQNSILGQQNSGLEDQMALLFSQLNKDMYRQCKESYEKVSNELDNQDRLSLTRATFRQTIQSLSDQMRHSSSLINEVRELFANGVQNDISGGRNTDMQISKEPSIRFKLKQIDQNFQQLIGRFALIKDIVVDAAQELMEALQERKNILYFSLQHIRLYDIKNAKMRRCRAVVVEMRRSVEELLKRMAVTFPAGAVTFVDRIGRISTQQWQVGQTLATIRNQKPGDILSDDADALLTAAKPAASVAHLPSAMNQSVDECPLGTQQEPNMQYLNETDKIPFQTIFNISDILTIMERSMGKLNNILNFDNEMNAFIKSLTIPLSTTPRDVEDALGELADLEVPMERALIPTGNATVKGENVSETNIWKPEREADGALGGSFYSLLPEEKQISAPCEKVQGTTAAENERILKLQEKLDKVLPEFTAKATFLRQVYEARISDLELKEANFRRKFNLQSPSKESVKDQKEGKEYWETKRRLGRTERDRPQSRSSDVSMSDRRRKKDDKEQLIQSRTEWQHTKHILRGNTKVRETTLKKLGNMIKGENENTKTSEKTQSFKSKGTVKGSTTP